MTICTIGRTVCFNNVISVPDKNNQCLLNIKSSGYRLRKFGIEFTSISLRANRLTVHSFVTVLTAIKLKLFDVSYIGRGLRSGYNHVTRRETNLHEEVSSVPSVVYSLIVPFCIFFENTLANL